MTFLKKMFYAGLALTSIAAVAYIVSRVVGKDPETMTIDELNHLMNECVKEDSRIGYLKAAYVRDIIKRKKKELSMAA